MFDLPTAIMARSSRGSKTLGECLTEGTRGLKLFRQMVTCDARTPETEERRYCCMASRAVEYWEDMIRSVSFA
jgi:hypothetical protein